MIVRFFDTYKGRLPARVLAARELSPIDKLVLLRLGQYEGKGGQARPKLGTLADELGISRDTAKRAVTSLAAVGLIEITLRDKERRPSIYRFLDHPWIHEDAPRPGAVSDDEIEDEMVGAGAPPSGDVAVAESAPHGGADSNMTVGAGAPLGGANSPPMVGAGAPPEGSQRRISEKDLREGSQLKAPPPVAPRSKARKAKPVQPELPAIPPKPPREPSYEEMLYGFFQDRRRMRLEKTTGFVDDKPLNASGQFAGIRSLLGRCQGDDDAREDEILRLFDLFLSNDYAASQEPPFPFALLAYSKTFTTRLVAELRGEAREAAH